MPRQRKTVRWDHSVIDTPSTKKRLPQKPIPNLAHDAYRRYAENIIRSTSDIEKYARDRNMVAPKYRHAYPSFDVWKAFRRYGTSRGLDYRTGNVEDYMLSELYPLVPLEDMRYLYPPGFSLKRT
jgi:hypothetical protein